MKSHPKYSGQNDKGKKSSTQPQLSIPDDPSKELVGEGPILQNEVSAGGTGHIQPETSDTTCPNANASVPLTNSDTLPTIDDTVGTKSSEVKNNSENDKSQSNRITKLCMPIHLKKRIPLSMTSLKQRGVAALQICHH